MKVVRNFSPQTSQDVLIRDIPEGTIFQCELFAPGVIKVCLRLAGTSKLFAAVNLETGAILSQDLIAINYRPLLAHVVVEGYLDENHIA